MEQIYTITTIVGSDITKINSRCIGFYFDLDVAIKEVENNSCDMFEFSYTYCVIEEVKQGLYYFPRKEVWFKWDNNKNGYVRLEEKPDIFKSIGGFSIG